MDILEDILSQEIVHKLGWTLLHSVWQGCVVALLLVVLLRVLRKSSANLRYLIACLGLAVIVLLPVVTFYVVPAPAPTSDLESVSSSPVPVTGRLHEVYDPDMPLQRAAEYMQMNISWKQRAMNFYASALPYIVFGWLIGVLALSLWHLGGWAHLQRLKRQKVNQVDPSLKGKLRNLAERLKVTRPVKLIKSALVQIPTVVGWFRPMILMPASALAGLSPEQLEALLAHELAHIRRYDYLVNMLQTVVEILGFYHPVVWWVSYKIRVERENCCDDLAVSVCGDKVCYARALTSMEETRFAQSELAVAASGGSLSRRIRRLIGAGSAEKNRFGNMPLVISILLIMALMIPVTLALTTRHENTDSSSNVATQNSSTLMTVEADRVSMDTIKHYVPWQESPTGLDETAAQAQILFDCKIYEVPADLKFLESEQKKDTDGQIILLGQVYADQLESLSRENENVKVLSAPRVIILNGEEAKVLIGAEVPYTAGYETGENADEEPKPIIKMAFAGLELKIKGETIENGLKLDLNINYGQLKPGFGTHKDDEGREIQVPVMERRECAAIITVHSDETIVIGGLRSSEEPLHNLILTIIPSIVLPEKGPEKAKIEMETSAVDSDPGLVAELQNLLKQEEDLKIALEDRALKLQQRLNEVQMKLAELETRKAELSELNRFSSALASAKEPKSDEEPRYHTVRKGETLSSISEKYYGSENKWKEILDCNREIITSDGIRVGQKLVIPTLHASAKEVESERKGAKKGDEPGDHPEREDDSTAELGVVLDDKRREAEMTAIEVEMNNSEWWAEMRAFTADVVVARRCIIEANIKLENDLALLENMKRDIASFELKHQDDLGTDTVINNQWQAMKANRKKLEEKIERDKAVLAKYKQDLKKAEYWREKYARNLPKVDTDSSEVETKHERLAVMAAWFAKQGDFAKAIEYQERAIEIAKAEKHYGIGIAIEKADGLIRISQVLPDTPASASSFRPGDIIEAINGVSTEGMSLNEVVARIRGPKGTQVALTVKSHSQDITMEEPFTRELLLQGSLALDEYLWHLDAYKAGMSGDEYLKMIKQTRPTTVVPAPRIFELKYADAEELARVLNRVLERRRRGAKDKPTDVVQIIPETRTNRLIILASPTDIGLIEALIVELDVSPQVTTKAAIAKPRIKSKPDIPAESTITQVISLKYANCEDIEEKLMILFPDEQFRIVSDKRTNTLIVAGTKSAIEKIKSLVTEIDVSVPGENLEIQY
jgi:beta-lactamase regulating signal transducer with metallopeptidase domain/LysM repeat protein